MRKTISDDNCIFCGIVCKEIESWIVYEDELVIAFLDVNPVSVGHTLIAPKIHYENIFDIKQTLLERIISITKKIAEKYKISLNIQAVNIFHASGEEAQQTISHFHLHLIPRRENDGLDILYKTKFKHETNFDLLLKKLGKSVI